MIIIVFVILFVSSFFFFKQKTAYEMRISDWSSDVCSSDLPANYYLNPGLDPAYNPSGVLQPLAATFEQFQPKITVDYKIASDVKIYADWGIGFKSGGFNGGGTKAIVDGLFNQVFGSGINVRSEEHTSELQSLMRISYAVFCLKKKK